MFDTKGGSGHALLELALSASSGPLAQKSRERCAEDMRLIAFALSLWIALFARDLTNSIGHLMLNFIS